MTNGFTANLKAKQAAALSKDPAVLAVTPDELRKPTTNKSPRFLGLRGPNGLWNQLGKKGTDGAGSSTVIGVVDSGIWPESRSFRSFNKGDSRAATADSLGYSGDCDPGDDGSFAGACNNKLIGGRYYVGHRVGGEATGGGRGGRRRCRRHQLLHQRQSGATSTRSRSPS
ncbi:MAG: S8 family serine peptidase [Actinomycetota bacterium]|nr:S8 family serine peptidase [Actinomycetota bacterium]MDQ3430726.1 S8 family serine peptidase [Actinomycetota bacterium]